MPPLTAKILDEFVEFHGSMLAYVEKRGETLSFDWDRIDELLGKIFLVRAGYSSANFRAQVESEIAAISADHNVSSRLWRMGVDHVVRVHGKVAV